MATECRRKRINRNKLMKVYAYSILILLFVIGGVMGFLIGTKTAPVKKEIVTEVIEVPVSADELPELEEVFYYDVPLSHSLQRYIYELCSEENVPVPLVMAMIEYESSFNPEVVSPTEDYGLMQINKINHEWLKEEYRCADMLNPYQNVFCGIKIISKYIEKYEDYDKALMAYNMGEYGAKKAWENEVASTNYSTRILELMAHYEEVSNATRD